MKSLYHFSQSNSTWEKFFEKEAVIKPFDKLADIQLCEILESYGIRVLGQEEYNNYSTLCRAYGVYLPFQVEYSSEDYYKDRGIEIIDYHYDRNYATE